MKSLIIVGLLTSGLALNANANEGNVKALNADTKHENIVLADTSQVGQDKNNALRLRFISRRPYQNQAVRNKSNYKADDAWVGATIVDVPESEVSKSLNRRFTSKRPHMKYKFD